MKEKKRKKKRKREQKSTKEKRERERESETGSLRRAATHHCGKGFPSFHSTFP